MTITIGRNGRFLPFSPSQPKMGSMSQAAIITFANQKGGVLKTSAAVSLGHGLARAGKRVLIIDLDPQGHVAISLGMDKEPGLYKLIVEQAAVTDVTKQARPQLDIIPGDKFTDEAKHKIVNMPFGEGVLLRKIQTVTAVYDVIILDLAPSLDILHVAALVASQWVIIPAKLDHLSLDGINEIIRSVAEISQHGHEFEGFFILPTLFDRTTKETAVQFQRLAEAFGAAVWPPIPTDTKAREATAYGKTVWEYCPDSAVVTGYPSNNGRIGGYAEILKRLEAIL